jgi:hypothetical protein
MRGFPFRIKIPISAHVDTLVVFILFLPHLDTLPVVLYGCETWSLTLREVHRLKVFENKVLRRILVPEMDDIAQE